MSINQIVDEGKVDLLNHQLKIHGRPYWFFHDLKQDVIYTEDKLVPLFKGMQGVPAGYNITSGYLNIEDAEEHMGL